ncbi:tRNA (N6-isopentenyl adenosine(37)-C2)-methylthiotransferase MiaB [Aminipila butyrica]|uniref:tRNA-2-methylthio-N(6)-dimethylallyladenosine synthase n=2 Tax=Aminipila butyrica TaxID=433296 RepID=A0A858BXL2_9FIRM|nr:tRNA (N6-isopentenyl adenosine(37)-C2)-methylthiotransferase MiaB [Aminipila butyrica]QIB70703.1 tRNA (N6-isopentenyl adenosine(37)-C2)-methylthiotransferase MiaB [Aminipila butyrica]
MNEHDSETMAGMLNEKGFAAEIDKEQADLVIINTCSVRDNADKRFFGTLGQLKKIKERNPGFVACVCGCMMQQQHVIDEVKTKYPWVDLVFGTHNIHEFPRLLDNVIGERQKIVDVWQEGGAIVEGLPVKRLYDYKALVNIMYGCNNFCTYCIVPYTRGRERSRQPEEIIREVKELTATGVKEITLLGQNVNSYGISHHEEGYWAGEGGMDFADLIYALNDVEGLERIRFMTSHPKDLSDKLIQAFKDCSKLCNAIHLPVQSGSDRVLKRMNRKYTRADYLTLIEKLRLAAPHIAITTDLIVGFPGETEEDFQDTMDLVEQVRYDSAFTFIYSIRKGTPAEDYEDQVPEEVKHQRFNRLLERINQISGEINQTYEHTIQQVLVEGISKSKKGEGLLAGRTESAKLVNFPGDQELVGQIVPVHITEGKQFNLKGIMES